MFKEENQPLGITLKGIDVRLEKAISQSLKETDKGFGKIAIINTMGLVPPQRILVASLGRQKEITKDSVRFVSGKIAKKAREMNLQEFSIVMKENLTVDVSESIAQIVEGVKLSLYAFDKFKANKEKRSPDLTILASKSAKIQNAIKSAEIVSDGVIFTKSIANLPANECSPATLANFAQQLARNNNAVKCKIFAESELKKKGFGGILAVGKGSKNKPRLIVLDYNRAKKQEQKQHPIVIVGKAVTFDTGGISIKPGERMNEMKFDKCGGCTVLGIMKAVSELKLPIRVIGVVPSVENMPGGGSYRPGDIIKLYNGKTAEILNTDAEGRLILADALAYSEKIFSPKVIIDFATLTGACIVALGTNIAGLVSNDEKLVKEIKQSSEATTEEVWQLPLNEDYMNMIKSQVADMKNMGVGRAAGTIAAAAFLRNAIEKTPWLHLDIAGVAWTQVATKEKPYNPKGATGFGVRLILDYLRNKSS
jgi:leucyl aminopeptidase